MSQTRAFEVILLESSGATVLTPWVSNLVFRLIDPGGYGSVQFDLSRKIDARQFEEQADIEVYDHKGNQVCGGRILNPGRQVDRGGEVWKIEVLGEGPAHMRDRTEPYILADTRLDVWYQSLADESDIGWSQGGPPDPTGPAGVFGSQGWVFKAEEGATMATGDGANISYSEFEEFPDARIGGYHYRPSGGATTVNHVIKVSSDGWATTDESDTWPVGGTFVNEDVASVASPRTEIQIRYQYVGGGFTADTKTWAYLHEFYVIAMRRDRNGDWIDSGTTYLGIPNALPTTGEIIIDLWARYCPRLDLPNARIDDSGMTHSDVVYPDGIDPQGVLEQLMERDPGHTWGLYERQDNGLFRAEWRTYDTDVRYELSTEDGGFSETSTTTKHDKIFATIDGSNSSTGRYAVRSFEDPDPQLAARGILPTMTVKTESDYWVTDEALKDMLDERTLEAGSAQLNINRRVLDHYTGRYVEPWEVLPGYLCRVAGAPRRNDVLNEFEPDGSAVVKLVSNEYNVAAGESKLELNGFTQTQLRALANLVQKQK